MKQIATVTLIVAHNVLTPEPEDRHRPASTLELITDLLEESYDAEIDILHAEAQSMMLQPMDVPDLDLDRRRRAMEARLAEERAERNAVRLAQQAEVEQS